MVLLFLTTGLGVLFLTNISLGSVSIPIKEILRALFSDTGTASEILWQFRLPKALTCILAGSALATGGLLMQTLFRNPMAGPDVLGLTSGASLFVALLLMAGQYSGLAFIQGPWSVALAASLGGATVFILIIGIARYVQDNTALLIVGLMISAATSSVVSVLQFTSQANDLQTFMIWMLGSVGSTNWSEIIVLALIVVAGLAISMTMIKALNGMLLGESYAVSLGINIKQGRIIIVLITGMMVGAVTAFCGPIAFVGLAVPHLVRLILPTTNHKTLLPAVCLGGATLLLLCDILAQLPGSTQVLPLNAITSLIGAPIVIWMVIKAKRISV
ncbi:MAG: ABC-type transporter permease protein [Bacteroidetes bacterium OLB12]|nr:MAG: ABC-type transporter permease protein [Bacteroidetes bacterium OLB12]